MKTTKKIINKMSLAFNMCRTLAADRSTKVKMFYIIIWFPYKDKLFFSNDGGVKLNIKKFNRTFEFICDNIFDFLTFKSIFYDEEYKLELVKEPTIIFDLGGNIGLSAIYFSLKYPNSTIYSFEPDINNFDKLKKNVKPFLNIQIFNIAISGIDGYLKFYVNIEKGISSSLQRRNAEQRAVNIKSNTLDSIINKLNISKIDLLKFDIEGSEYEALKNFKSINIIEYFIGELHLDLIGVNEGDFLKIFNNYKKTNKIISKNKKLFCATRI